MDHSVSFARHFARLLWLLMRESDKIDEQKAALKAAFLASSDAPVTLALEGTQLAVNGVPLTEGVGVLGELTQRLVGHEVRELNAVAGATEADLLNAARTLAAEPTFGPEGGTAAERLA